MFKATPNPPHTDPLSPHETLDPEKLDEAARRALDYYLKPNHGQPDKKTDKQLDYFIVAPDADPEGMLAHSYETFCSVSTLILDLSEDLEGAPRNLALAIHQMGEMGVLLLERLLDNEAKIQR
ncbi:MULTISPECIES: DUF6124 family protein [Pseudomonas]|jgi:hypothetical protein|uniref:DUF3077 domain-containing protein n=1 Tax=Pseudomonas bijieensis TaxID=2681983 RepID=A0A6N1CKA7_9PSED|nr:MULTISPECIES: DUF6124 family protein [Pseudomonas]AUM71496.1 hypothetical protein C0J56_23365 [Pseudomonas fluorescens]MCD9117338.1 DUF6124 family protein [Pseudomonas bijieensis]QKS84922.1 hypothetical protein GN234_24580 [Pseudomonas bijieensis]